MPLPYYFMKWCSRTRKSGLALLNLGAVLYRQQKYAEAADAYQRASQVDTVAEAARLSLAKVLITLVRFEEAKPLLETYVRDHPANMEAHYLLGITYQGWGCWRNRLRNWNEPFS